MDELARHHLGFRSRYLTYAEIERQLRAWADAYPEIVRLESIGQSEEGRELYVLTIGRDPDRVRPAAWADGNMHASEVAGSSVALAIAETMIRAHINPKNGLADLPPHAAAGAKDVLTYVLPRMSPDGAEQVLTTGRWIRSNPRDRRVGRIQPRWRTGDVDGDGLALLMRRRDPTGDYVESKDVPGLLLPRTLEDDGPFYAVYPEGTIENYDGWHVPPSNFLGEHETDLNRNFASNWRAEPHQIGAGAHALSEPEAMAVTRFAVQHPNIYAWLNLHTFGGVYIRPSGDESDAKMNQDDLALFRQLAVWGEAASGYPMVSGYEEFTYEPDKPLCGDLSRFAYAERGTIAFVCELWDLFAQAGLPVLRPFVHNYQRRTRAEVTQIGKWDREKNQGRVFCAWRPFEHPQLGPVEVGGFDPRFGMWNPPPDRVGEICEAQSKLFARLVAIAPRLELSVSAERLGGGLSRVEAVVENRGYLGSYILDSSKGLPWNAPVAIDLSPIGDASLVAGEPRAIVGHLEGWGGSGRGAIGLIPRTARGPMRRRVEWTVRGGGKVRVRAGAPRVGYVEVDAELPV